MKLQHISKTGFTLPGVGETDDHGVIDVTEEQAGRPPEPRIEEATTELKAAIEAVDHVRSQALRAEIVALDFGTGLLAQDVWQPHGSKAKAALKQEDDK